MSSEEPQQQQPAADKKEIPATAPVIPEPRIKGVQIILPYLLMGSADVATNLEELQYLGVKHIMNCASEDVDNFFEDHFTYTAYPIEDTHEGEPEEYFEESYEVIAKIKEEKSVIFVHCTTGKNIAPTIVLNYMLRSAAKQQKHLSLAAAYKFLGSKFPGVQVTDQFMSQLLDVEDELFDDRSIKIKGARGGHFGGSSRLGGGRGGRGGRGGKGKRGK